MQARVSVVCVCVCCRQLIRRSWPKLASPRACSAWYAGIECVWQLSLSLYISSGSLSLSEKREKRTPPKKSHLENLFGLKQSFPFRCYIETRETISTTEIFPLWPPFLSAKKSSSPEQGGACSFYCLYIYIHIYIYLSL